MGNHSFESLSHEHKIFLDFFRQKKKKPSNFYDVNRWRILGTLLEKIHHEKEENFLFPHLLQTDALNAGGIKCATFFTPRVLSAGGWPDSYHELEKSLKPAELEISALNSVRQIVFREKNMLAIPIEDHILGARALKRILQNEPNHMLIDQLAALLIDHIEREEDCLYELCERILNAEQKDTFRKKAEAYDAEHQTKTIITNLLAP